MTDATGEESSRSPNVGQAQFYGASPWQSDLPLDVIGDQDQRIRPTNKYAWGLALSPLVVLVLAFLVNLSNVGVPPIVASIVGLGMAVGLAVADAAAIRAAGGRMSQLLAIFLTFFLGLLYLIVRAVRIRGGYVLPIVWCVAVAPTVLLLIVVFLQGPVGVYAADDVETTIADAFPNVFGADPDVSCPHDLAEIGDQMVCTVTSVHPEIADVRATLVDKAGTVDLLILRW